MLECKLEDIAEIVDCEHKTAMTVLDSEYYSIRTTNILGGKLDFQHANRVSKQTYIDWTKRATPESGDLILAREAPVGEIGLIKDGYKVCLGQRTVLIKVKSSDVNSRYLLYYFVNPTTKSQLQEQSGGSVVAHLNMKDIRNFDIKIPSLIEQNAIASTLSSLDDKIDLLHRQNTTLERMAETLFRQWFVEEAQEDWSPVVLGEYVNCFNGVSYKSSELNPSKMAMVTLKSFDRNGGFRLDGFKEFTGKYKEQHIVVQGDLVVAHTDITQDAEVIGNPVLVVASPSYETIVISMDLVKVASKFDWLSNEFLYRMMRTREFKEHCLGYSNGSTVLHLNKQAIPSYEFFLPPKVKIQSFTVNVKNMLGKKFKNIEQIQTLEKLRDTLLPKLMSGEVKVEV